MGAELEAIEERLTDLAVQMAVVRTMSATAVAAVLRTTSAGHQRQILDELRRNIALAMMQINLQADEATVLTYEDAIDRMIDEIVRLSQMPNRSSGGGM